MENEFATWSGGVDLFRDADKLDSTLFEALPNGTWTMMNTKPLSSSAFRSLFPTEGAALFHLSDGL